MWNLKIKVGHSVCSIAELLTIAKSDMTVRTAFLEARPIWGEQAIFDLAMQRFRAKIVSGTAGRVRRRQARRARRAAPPNGRHAVTSSSPTSRTARAGFRDLHTLYWIGKYVHGVERALRPRPGRPVHGGRVQEVRARRALLLGGALPSARARQGAEELRLRAPAADRRAHALRRPAGKTGSSGSSILLPQCETVGDLTGIFLAQLDEQLGKKGFRFALPTIRRQPKRLAGFVLDRGRLRSRATTSSPRTRAG